jgi:hydroxymethylglutaryl-CoA synthase
MSSTKTKVLGLCTSWVRSIKAKDTFSVGSSSTGSLRTFSSSPPISPVTTNTAGILAAEFYIPHRYVSQGELEKFDKVSAGKYTIGLGQSQMAFVDDREDINSIALTAVHRLLECYNIDPKQIGRLDVGTESLVDKSKSTKTTLMQLFSPSGNRDIEGATVMNACYGGTASLLNSVAWVNSPEAHGRFAIYVACDIAVYEPGPARPTGGVGAVACLVGPDAPLSLVPGARHSHSVDVYDFYKPKMSSEYPAVDGKLSQSCYVTAVDDCYTGTISKLEKIRSKQIKSVEEAFDHVAFHSPYNKLVQQSFKRMLYNDARRLVARGQTLPDALSALAPFASLPAAQTLANKDLDKILSSLGGDAYKRMVGPSESISKNIGNSYTGALHMNLVSLLGDAQSGGSNLEGKSIGAFSYGSGAIATMLAFSGRKTANKAFSLSAISKTLNVSSRLKERIEASPEEFTNALLLREAFYGKSGASPVGSVDNVPSGAYFLKEVTKEGGRVYERK